MDEPYDEPFDNVGAGSLIPEVMEDELRELYAREFPTALFHPGPWTIDHRLTRRQRIRYQLSRIRWGIHDRLFPECDTNDDW